MPVKLSVFVLAAVLGVAAAPAARADTVMRCDTHVVSRGLTFLEVLERCGAPDAQYARVDVRVAGLYLPVEEWIYELGSNRFRRLLTFENGRLTRIEQRPKPVVSVRSLSGG